jgi:signal transduction histidine kinase
MALADFWPSLQDKCALLPREPGVALVWSGAPSGVELGTDPRKLTVVLRNLIGNALKYTLAGQAIVRVEARGDSVVFAVSDTGIGIPAEAQSQIFERFSRVEGTSEQFGGLGLGLFIVRRLVQQLGGTIAVSSEVGRGSTFTVTLPRPRRTDASIPWREAGRVSAAGDGNGASDDEASVTRIDIARDARLMDA